MKFFSRTPKGASPQRKPFLERPLHPKLGIPTELRMSDPIQWSGECFIILYNATIKLYDELEKEKHK